MSDADINELAHELSEIVLEIGKDALPDLEYLAINENFNLTVTNIKICPKCDSRIPANKESESGDE